MHQKRPQLSQLALRANARCAAVIFVFMAVFCPVKRVSAQSFEFTVNSVSSYIIVPTGKWVVNNVVSTQQYYFTNIILQPIALNGVAYPSGTPNYMSFCGQIDQDISLSNTYTFNFAPLNQVDNGLTATQVRELRILFDLYYKGDNLSNWTNDTAAAFQACIWEIETDTGLNLSSGSFRDNGSGDTFVTLGQSYLNAIAATGTNYTPSMNVVGVVDPTYQDLLFTQTIVGQLTPFPVGAVPGAAALGVLAFIRVRRRLSATAASSLS